MAASKALYSALDAVVTLIDDSSVQPLKNLAVSAIAVGADFDNSPSSTNRRVFADIYLHVRGSSTGFVANDFISVWFLRSFDGGSTWEDGDSTPTTPARPPDVIIPVRAVTTQQNVVIPGIVMPPGHFKPCVKNTGSIAFTNTAAENTLKMQMYVIENQ